MSDRYKRRRIGLIELSIKMFKIRRDIEVEVEVEVDANIHMEI